MVTRFSRFEEGERIERISIVVSTIIGILEVLVAAITGSIALTADGILSFADSGVALLVFFGLNFTKRKPDDRFHFGYYKVENLAAFGAAVFMAFVGVLILVNSYLRFLSPIPLQQTTFALVAAAIASLVSAILAFYKIKTSRRIGSSAMKVDSLNSVKDSLSSVLVLASLFLTSSGWVFMDSVAGFIMALFLFSVAYVAIRESSLILIDACNCPDILEQMKWAAISVEGVKKVRGIKLRRASAMIFGEMVLEVDRNMTIVEANTIARNAEKTVKGEVKDLEYLAIRVEPEEN